MRFLLQKLRAVRNIILKRPILSVYDVTYLCNQNCVMCNIKQPSSNDLPLCKIEEKAKILSDFGITDVYLQGGDPLIRKDILDIADIFIKNGITPTIITNGILLNEDLLMKIASRRCNLSISIDTFDEKLYTYMRGINSLNKVLSNLEIIKTKKIKRKGYWSITSTVSNLSNLEDLISINKYADNLGLHFYVRPYNCNLNNAGKEVEELKIKNEEIKNIFEYFRNKEKNKNILASIIYDEVLKTLNGSELPICDAMRFTMVMDSSGEFSSCIEHKNFKFNIDNFKSDKKYLTDKIKNCNKNTPCIYGCTRNIGFLYRNKLKLIFSIFSIIKTLHFKSEI